MQSNPSTIYVGKDKHGEPISFDTNLEEMIDNVNVKGGSVMSIDKAEVVEKDVWVRKA